MHAALLGGEGDPPAVEAAVVVVTERTGQQPGSSQHLEAVADPEHGPATVDERAQLIAEASAVPGGEVEGQHATGTERVAVAEPAGDDEDPGGVQQAGSRRSARPPTRRLVRRRPDRAPGRRPCHGSFLVRRRRSPAAGSPIVPCECGDEVIDGQWSDAGQAQHRFLGHGAEAIDRADQLPRRPSDRPDGPRPHGGPSIRRTATWSRRHRAGGRR